MSYELKAVICGNQDSITNTEFKMPATIKILFDPTAIKPYITSHSKSVFFIIILLHLFGQTIEILLTEIGNQDNIIGIYVCVDQIYNLAHSQTNVFHLSKRLL